jgi:hypothetical protein
MSVREELIAELANLTDEQMTEVLQYVQYMKDHSLQGYDPANDPILTGEFDFSGLPDLAMRSKEILRAEFGLKKPQQPSGDEVE